jgi:sigma-B regulation protein RsbU (phosphoserine phosphatase)
MIPEFVEASARLDELRVLVVDDCHQSRLVAASVLRQQGVRQIFFATDGQEALTAALEHTPDLILLDLIMPNMDGYACCRALRQLPGFTETPIIVQTGVEDTAGLTEAFAAGATDFVRKPIHANELISRTQVHLERLALMKILNAQQRQLQQELQAARAMQEMMLPDATLQRGLAELYGIDLAVHHQPCQSLSGDLWSAQPLGLREVAFWQIDFSGHGMLATMNGFRFHALTQARLTPASDPGSYLSELNTALHELLPRHCFATMFYGVLDVEAGRLRFSTAAHTTPLILRADGSLLPLEGQSFPLGALKESTYRTEEVPFTCGDTLFLYSDGLMERWERFDEAALLRLLHSTQTAAPEEATLHADARLRRLLDAVQPVHATAPLKDDLSVMVIQYV